jgi:NAD(P)-dependent dehydrogenase (short-subunit alcohol dehydrogenase family)
MDSRPVRRLTITLGESYADFRRRFEATVPVLDSQLLANLVKRNAGWDGVITYANAAAPLDFFLFWSLDVGPTMSLNGNTSNCCEYLMGNYVIAQRAFRFNPLVMLYAPLAAIRNFARSWAVDLKGTGIRVNVLAPGPDGNAWLDERSRIERDAGRIGGRSDRSNSDRAHGRSFRDGGGRTFPSFG